MSFFFLIICVTWQEFPADFEVVQHLRSTLFCPGCEALCQKRRLVVLFSHLQQVWQHACAHHRWLRKHVGLILLVQTGTPERVRDERYESVYVCSPPSARIFTGSGLYLASKAPCCTEWRSSRGR